MLIMCSTSLAQEKFTYDKQSITDYVVINTEGTASEIYKKTINWIKEGYKNPDEVILMTIENEKLRFQGFSKNFSCWSSVCSDASYTIEISFKDGKYKFDLISLKAIGQTNSFEVPINDLSIYYNKKGEFRTGSKDFLDTTVFYFNALQQSLSDYISGKSKKEEW